jgi:heterodisulfide reductase subunit A2
MLEVQRSKNIELFTLAEVTKVDGYVGNFEVEILQKAKYTESDCNGCGACTKVCPAIRRSEFDQGLGEQNAIYISFAQAVPFKAQIDMDACILCGNCANVCELKAVNFDQKDTTVKVKVGGIIVATGWDEYKPEVGYLGYKVYDNVLTQLTFERMLAPNGPVVGHIVKPSDGQPPKSILFVNCVGSRDIKRNAYCSSGVCCMVSIKNAKLVKAHYPDMEVAVAYIDIRAAGKGYEEYYLDSRKQGVKYIRSKVAQVHEDPDTRSLKIVLEDTLSPEKTIREHTFDMVVLSAAMQPSNSMEKLNKVLKLPLSIGGFLKEFHSRLNTVDTDIPGIALSGGCHGAKSIAETIMQAKGAASSIGKLINNGEYRILLIRAVPIPGACAKCGMCEQACPYHAITIDPELGAQVNEILCRGCGICAAVCPSSAITIRYYRDNQIVSMIDAFFDEDEPVIEKS